MAMPLAKSADLPSPRSSSEALELIMTARHGAQSVLRPDASPQDLRQGAAQLERLRSLLDEQPYRDFISANTSLFAEQLNIAIPLAEFYARLGEKEKALLALESTTGVALIPALESLAQDPNLAAVKDEPRFKAVMAKHLRGAIASSKGFASPYREHLTREQRIAGLSLFWSEVRHNFANVDLMPQQEWDAIYMDYLRKSEKAKSTTEYYAMLMQLAALLHDGHTNIYPPQQLNAHFFARPPLETGLVEGAVVVLAVHDAQLERRIRPGDQVLAIDGIDVKAYAERFVRPFVSSSTEQDRKVRMYAYQLLSGDAEVALTLTLKDSKGRHQQVKVSRSGWGATSEARLPFRMLPSGVAYLRLDQFENDEGVKAFEEALPAIQAAKGLILDVRTNGGGSTQFAWRILSYLLDKPIQPTSSRVRFEDQNFRAQAGDFVSWRPLASNSGAPAIVSADRIFKGPVALLIGPKTFSAAEDFVAAFTQAHRGVLVGETTGGSTGQPLKLELPGGGSARICVKRDFYNDGTDFVGRGISPTFTVENTVAAVRDGTDPALREAENVLIANPGQYVLRH